MVACRKFPLNAGERLDPATLTNDAPDSTQFDFRDKQLAVRVKLKNKILTVAYREAVEKDHHLKEEEEQEQERQTVGVPKDDGPPLTELCRLEGYESPKKKWFGWSGYTGRLPGQGGFLSHDEQQQNVGSFGVMWRTLRSS